MEFKEFKKHMDRLKQQSDNSFALYKAFGCEGPGVLCDDVVDSVIDLLEDAMGDTGEWMSYWIYDLDFGSEYKDGSVVDEEGNTINIRTVEDLYNRLTEWGKEE